MREAVEEETPFFLHFAPYAVHTPIMANDRYLKDYGDLHPTEAAYATMVQSVDAALGAVLDTLEELDITENTIVVFTSDNGGLSAVARGGLKHTHNAPLRSGKGSAYEGGTRVPLVIAWPGFGSDRSATASVISHDLYPTLLAGAGVELRSDFMQGIEGQDLSPMLNWDGRFDAGRPLFWNQPHQWGAKGPGIEPFTSVRVGNHKLIYFHAGPRFELYDLEADLGETRNLASKDPSRVRSLASDLDRWIRKYDVQLSIDKETGMPIPLPGTFLEQAEKD